MLIKEYFDINFCLKSQF